MSITKQFKSVSRRLVIIIVSLSVLSVGLLSFALYEANLITFDDTVSSEDLASLVEDNPEVKEYLESEQAYEAHFTTIASLVKQDQQESLGEALLMITVPVIVIAGAIGYGVARYILRPVRESYESQERFLQDAAHELRNPLAAMTLAIENMRGKKAVDQTFVTTIKRQTKRLIRINEDLLYLERRTPGDPISEIDISNLLVDVLEDLQPAILQKKLQVNTDIQADIAFKIDPKDFIKMSKNIIENAIKYSKTGKKLDISLSNGKEIIFIVKDRGIGMSQEDLAHVGERFYRAKNVGKIDGTGLGMAIVNKIVNVYGGNIDIDSKINQGTTVKITF